MQTTATRLIGEFSEANITVERTTIATVVDGVVVPGTVSTTSIPGVATSYDVSEINNTSILSGDLSIVINSGYEPMSDDVFIIDGDRYHVEDIKPLKPSVTVLGYKVQVRK